MSWIVEFLIKNQDMIRNNITVKEETFFKEIPREYFYDRDIQVWGSGRVLESTVEYDLENDTYNNLLLIEKTIEDLKNKGKISAEEYKIIELIKNSIPPIEMERITGIEKQTIYKIFSNVCERIAFILGGEFTNEGTISSICQTRNLTEKQIETIRRYFEKNTVSQYI